MTPAQMHALLKGGQAQKPSGEGTALDALMFASGRFASGSGGD